ncbi:dienelactone hydrolase family protein [Streptomyces sp. NPDC057376]|uniref:dienelactone hydrolase family protein n=1 Tax=unclassified Streptomyces TaxID=2593676 RepID=UPI00362B6B45
MADRPRAPEREAGRHAFGLRPRLREMADRLAGSGYTVLVPNVFHRNGRAPVAELPEFIDPAADGPVALAAGFHGADLATEAPDGPHLVAGRITAELYFGHADQDPGLPAEQQERLTAALAGAGVRHRCEVYEGAAHGYTQADTAAYGPEATERHWAALLDLLERTF